MQSAQIDAVTMEDNGLTVDLPGIGPSYFNAWWLRDNCSTSFDRETRERSFDIFHHATTPRPADARLEDGALVIRWADEGQSVVYAIATNGDKGSFEMESAQLAQVRRMEALRSAGVLGVREVVFLDHRDGELDQLPPGRLRERSCPGRSPGLPARTGSAGRAPAA